MNLLEPETTKRRFCICFSHQFIKIILATTACDILWRGRETPNNIVKKCTRSWPLSLYYSLERTGKSLFRKGQSGKGLFISASWKSHCAKWPKSHRSCDLEENIDDLVHLLLGHRSHLLLHRGHWRGLRRTIGLWNNEMTNKQKQ